MNSTLKLSLLITSLIIFQACGDDDKKDPIKEDPIVKEDPVVKEKTLTTIKGITTLLSPNDRSKATVCIDKNTNNKCDTDEESGKIDLDGKFEFSAEIKDGDVLLAIGGKNRLDSGPTALINTFPYTKYYNSNEDSQNIHIFSFLILDDVSKGSSYDDAVSKIVAEYPTISKDNLLLDDIYANKSLLEHLTVVDSEIKSRFIKANEKVSTKSAFRTQNKYDNTTDDGNNTEDSFFDIDLSLGNILGFDENETFFTYLGFDENTTFSNFLDLDFNFFDDNSTAFADVFTFDFFDNNNSDDNGSSIFDVNLSDINLIDVNLSDINLSLPSFESVNETIEQYQTSFDNFFNSITAFYDKFLAYFGINDIDETLESNLSIAGNSSRAELNGAWLIVDGTTATNNKRCYYIQKSNALSMFEFDDNISDFVVTNFVIATHGKDDNETFSDINNTVSMEIRYGFVEVETINFTNFSTNHVFTGTYQADGVSVKGTKKSTLGKCKNDLLELL